MHLCLRWGITHPRHLIPNLSVDDYLDWLAYWEIDPPDAQRDDLRAYAAAIVSTGGSARLEPVYPFVENEEDNEPPPEEIVAIVAAQRAQTAYSTLNSKP